MMATSLTVSVMLIFSFALPTSLRQILQRLRAIVKAKFQKGVVDNGQAAAR